MGAIKGDTRSLDYSSFHIFRVVACIVQEAVFPPESGRVRVWAPRL